MGKAQFTGHDIHWEITFLQLSTKIEINQCFDKIGIMFRRINNHLGFFAILCSKVKLLLLGNLKERDNN